MIVYFANRKMEIVGQASTSLPKGYTIIEDTKIEEIETGVSSFECKIEFDNKSRLEIEEITNAGNYILRSNGDENEFYTIIETEIDTKEQYIYVYAEDAGLDLLNEIVGEYEATESHTAEWYINKYINDSGFEIGINEIPSTIVRKLKWDGEATCTERLASIANQFGGYEISYSYQINNMIITNKYVNIYKIRGKDVGVQLRLNRDIDRIITKKSVANLATAFKCTGGTPENSNTPITLKGYSYDDGDFYVGTDGVLRSRNACEKWSRYVWNKEPNQISGYKGNIIRLYSYDTTSQSTLCSHAITELKKICDMEVNYEVEINKLPDNVKIGDRVNIVDDEGKLYLSTRILQLETSVTEQTQKATLGDYLIKNDGISQKVVELAEQLAQRVEAEKKVVEDIIIVKATADKAKTDAGDALTTAGTANETASSANETANYVRENYVDIAMQKIDNAWVQSLIVKGNLIAQDITADEGTFYKLTGVRVYGDVIQANSIKADSLILKNSEDGLYYRLNVDSLGKVTADSDSKYQEGIDGSVIVAESITASKLKVDKVLANAILAQDITATGTISGITLKGSNLSLDRGLYFCLDDDINNNIGGISYESISSSMEDWSGYEDLVKISSVGDLEFSTNGRIHFVGDSFEFNGDNLRIYTTKIGFKDTYLNSALFLGTNTDSDGTRFYINNNGTGRFKTLFENGTALSSLYADKSHTSHSAVYSDTNVRIGNNGVTSTEYALATYWKDGSVHNLASRASDGLTSYFGWAGSSSYATICNLRSRTCRYTNASGTTNLSDVRLKDNFTSLDKWSSFFDAIEPCAFKMKTGNSGRFHIGYKAQQIEQALVDNGLTTQDFGGFIKMPYLPDSDNEEVNKVYEEVGIKEGEDEYGLIYTEFTALNTYEIQKLKTKVKEQQNEIEILKQRLENVEQKVGGNSAS